MLRNCRCAMLRNCWRSVVSTWITLRSGFSPPLNHAQLPLIYHIFKVFCRDSKSLHGRSARPAVKLLGSCALSCAFMQPMAIPSFTTMPSLAACNVPVSLLYHRALTFTKIYSDNFFIFLVSSLGLEPRTHALKGRCSTN